MRVQPAVGTQPYGPEGNPMGLTVRMHRPALTDHTLESPEEDVGRAESPAGAQWWTHIGDAPKTATAQRFRAPRSHTLTHSTGMRVP